MKESIEKRLTDLAMCDDSEHKAKMVVDIVKLIEQRERKAIEFTVRLFFITKQKYESPESVDKAFEKIYGLWKAQKGGKDEN